MATNQPLEFEQMTYNSPDGAQAGKTSVDSIGFYGATPVPQRASANQAIVSVSSAAGIMWCWQTCSTNGLLAGLT